MYVDHSFKLQNIYSNSSDSLSLATLLLYPYLCIFINIAATVILHYCYKHTSIIVIYFKKKNMFEKCLKIVKNQQIELELKKQ